MEMVPAMALALDASFGSVERWRAEFVSLAKAQGHSGGVVLAFSEEAACLVNRTEDGGAPPLSGFTPVLRLDRPATIDSFLPTIDWADVYARYQRAVEEASEGCGVGVEALADALVLDVRRKAMFEQAATRLPGADWRDPARVTAWSGEIPSGRPVVVYCVYGHEVGRATALRLRAAGVDARFLEGGIDGWRSAGRALEAKEVTT